MKQAWRALQQRFCPKERKVHRTTNEVLPLADTRPTVVLEDGETPKQLWAAGYGSQSETSLTVDKRMSKQPASSRKPSASYTEQQRERVVSLSLSSPLSGTLSVVTSTYFACAFFYLL